MTVMSERPVAPGASVDVVGAMRSEIGRCVVGMRREIDLMLCAVLAGRHVLVEGVPGLGKTHLVKTLAAVMGCSFRRIQFTPDLLPADILGGNVYNPRDGGFELRRGPIFANVILADEINRAPAKTQSALLEVMQESQVTIEGQTIRLEPPFFVFATQNPVEHEGVYPLPQAQLDRFAVRIIVKYPPMGDERRMLAMHRQSLPEPSAMVSSAQILAAQQRVGQVTVSEELIALIVNLINHTRQRHEIELGASPRVGLDLLHMSRAHALLANRAHVIPDDVKALFFDVANHRLALSPQAEIGGLTVAKVIDEALRATKLV